MRFRKRPIVVEATQFFNDRPFPAGVCDCWADEACGGTPHVHTLEGPLHVSEGDWIITGVKGERYPCKPDVLEAGYEPVEDK
jgi:hypothetical protein